ncbi:MAG: ATP-binding protein [Opitutaceae bacterium]
MIESETIEFKKSLAERDEGLVSLAAILNKHGAGELWFGIKNDGTPVGMEVSEKTLRDLSQVIAAHIEPKIYPEITAEVLEGKTCLKVAFSGGERPYFANGRAYMRVSDADRKLSSSELERLILEKNCTYRSWDTEAFTLDLKRLHHQGIQAFVEKAGLTWTTPKAALENLGLLQDGKLLNAAAVFFALPPLCELRCAVFAGSSSATLLDQHSFRGGILELIEEAQRYILKNIRIGMKVEGLERIDVPEIDLEAIREAVINAFCHRDYRAQHEPVQIAIYQDRVEIRNPGSLIEGITLEDLRKGTISRRRNPLIAELLRRVKLVESWGRGIPLILEKAPRTTFELRAGVFVSVLQRSIDSSEKTPVEIETSEKTRVETRVEIETSEETRVETPVEIEASEKTRVVSEKASEKTPRLILDALAANPKMTLADLSVVVGKSQSAVERASSKLIQAGKLRRVGPKKGGHWEVLES